MEHFYVHRFTLRRISARRMDIQLVRPLEYVIKFYKIDTSIMRLTLILFVILFPITDMDSWNELFERF